MLFKQKSPKRSILLKAKIPKKTYLMKHQVIPTSPVKIDPSKKAVRFFANDQQLCFLPTSSDKERL